MNKKTKIKIYEVLIMLLLSNLLIIVGIDILHYKTNSFIIITNLISILVALVFIIFIIFEDEKDKE